MLSLLVAVALPLWVLFSNQTSGEGLQHYHFWLGIVSVLHLICLTCWVLVSERANETP